MRVTLPDDSERELPDGATGADLAASIGPGLARAALAIRFPDGNGRHDGSAYDEGRVQDLAQPLPDGATVEIVTPKDDDGDSLKLGGALARCAGPVRCGSSPKGPARPGHPLRSPRAAGADGRSLANRTIGLSCRRLDPAGQPAATRYQDHPDHRIPADRPQTRQYEPLRPRPGCR